MINYREKLKDITTFIFDFDGVLSDGRIWVLPDGEQIRSTGVKDGYALQYALRKGYRIAVISGGIGESMRLRYQRFDGMEIFLGVHDKIIVFNDYIAKHKISPDEIVYMGDDIPDRGIMNLVKIQSRVADLMLVPVMQD